MIDPFSRVHPNAKIGENVTIGPFCTIHDDVEIGSGTVLHSHVTIMEGGRIGKDCSLFPGSVIAAIPQDLKFKGERTTVEIGDRTMVRECATINRGTAYSGKTVVGKDCLIMAYSHIAHDCLIGDFCILLNSVALAGHIEIGDYVTISGLSAVHQFCRIGSYSFVAGGSLVRMDVPPYVRVAREPLAYMGVNSVRLERLGYTQNEINEVQNIYRVIYQGNHNMNKAIERLENTFKKTKELTTIIEFFRNTTRGVLR